MKLDKLLQSRSYMKIFGNRDINIESVTIDPRDFCKDCLLIVLKECTLLEYADLMVNFSAIICEESLFEAVCCITKRTVIMTKSVRKIWAECCSRISGIDYSKTKFIAVTGTNGKTTTATMIKHVLECSGYTVGFIGTGKIYIDNRLLSDENYSMTTPDPNILYPAIKRMQDMGAEYIVMEVSSHALFLQKTAPITFEVSAFTNISPEHLDFHHGIKEYLKAKLSLLDSSKLAVFNLDDNYLRDAMSKAKIPHTSIGVIWQGDAYATDVADIGLLGTSFIYKTSSFGFRANLKLPGKFNIYNAMIAISVCVNLGIPPCKVKAALQKFEGVEGRFQIVYNDDISVVIDYAHTEVAFESFLKALKGYSKSKDVSIVFGCGGERYRDKRKSMARTAEKYADKIYVTSDNSRGESPKRIFSDIIKGFKSPASYMIIEDRAEAIRIAVLNCAINGIVAIVGKGAEKYNIDATGYHPFDEVAIIRASIDERKRGKNESNS